MQFPASALFNIFFPHQGRLVGHPGGILYRRHVLQGSKSMQVIGSSGRTRYIGDAISILRQFNPSKWKEKQETFLVQGRGPFFPFQSLIKRRISWWIEIFWIPETPRNEKKSFWPIEKSFIIYDHLMIIDQTPAYCGFCDIFTYIRPQCVTEMIHSDICENLVWKQLDSVFFSFHFTGSAIQSVPK